jgi:signal transduction histidine kinase/CheY-like chemotaxis protein
VNQLAANLTTQVRAIAEVATAVTQGDLTRTITVEAQGEVAALKDTTNEMISNLRDTTQKNTQQDWLKTNLAKFSRMLQGQKDLNAVGRLILSELAPVVSAQQALFYVIDAGQEPPRLHLLASYAGSANTPPVLQMGEGLIGQCALEAKKILLTRLPEAYVHVSSGLGAARPNSVLVLPVVFEGQVRGVLELASLESFDFTHQAFLDQLMESIGIVINTIEANTRTEDLLSQSQSLAQELQSRQQELQQTNQELQEKARLLVLQNEEVESKNQEVEQARQALEEKAKQLALTSKYKSEFLANMSHELRTPLNSLLILSDQLCKNPDGNLSPKQVDFSKTIHASGNDLLMLINDILDLSKIESGTVAVDIDDLSLLELSAYVERTFRHVAESKGLEFGIRLDPQLPTTVSTDAKRLQQIIKNLLSNAFKFTHRGQVILSIEPARSGWSRENEDLGRTADVVAISVSDSGIGIPTDKQQIIFEAFQQADGSTNRKYGGTGLGLAISRELARLLHGEITLASVPGKGSTFTLYIPRTFAATRPARKLTAFEASAAMTAPLRPTIVERPAQDVVRDVPLDAPILVNEANDDRDVVRAGDRVLLIVENDLHFARLLLETAREQGYKGLVTSLGVAALAMAQEHQPAAITLDLVLPDISGWRVLERLKTDMATRHIPVCVMSTEDASERALRAGAVRSVQKPIQSKDALEGLLRTLREFGDPAVRTVVVVGNEGDDVARLGQQLAAVDGVEMLRVENASSAAALLATRPVACAIVDGSADGEGSEHLLRALHGAPHNPMGIVLYAPDGADGDRLDRIDHRIRRVRSFERLLDQTLLLLHRKVGALPEPEQRILLDIYRSNKPLAGKRALIVDDDMRNIFALSSVLEDHAMRTVAVDNGRDAIDLLGVESDIDIVLMDIMMPEMDGMDTIREIRKIPACKSLPIIAVTAKAMKGDRERCIEAGAWDYLSKPVDTEQMLSVLRAWLHP